jgi:hypothetical protein
MSRKHRGKKSESEPGALGILPPAEPGHERQVGLRAGRLTAFPPTRIGRTPILPRLELAAHESGREARIRAERRPRITLPPHDPARDTVARLSRVPDNPPPPGRPAPSNAEPERRGFFADVHRVQM